jgi:hypothetical protein
VRQRLPAAAQPEDLDIVLAAAVGDGLYDRVEAWDVAPASEDADALFHNSTPLIWTFANLSKPARRHSEILCPVFSLRCVLGF